MTSSSEPSHTAGPDSGPEQGRDARIALWLALTLFFFYLLTTSGHPPYGDEGEYLNVAQNILIRGRPIIEQIQTAADGQVGSVLAYNKLALGQSFLILPFAAVELIARPIVPDAFLFIPALVVNALPAAECAGIAAFVFLLMRLLGGFQPALRLTLGTTMAVTLTTALATQLWPASRTLFADTSAAFLLLCAVFSLVRFRRTEAGEGWALSAAWSAALAALCKNTFALTWPALAAYGLWAVMRHKKAAPGAHKNLISLAAMAALPLLLVMVAQFWFNHLRYGSIWLSGYHEGKDGALGFSTPLMVGLYGIFLSSGRSLFLYSSPCLLAFLGARKFFTAAPAETALIGGVSLPLLYTFATWWSWHGGWEWGNRFHLFLIPLLMLLSIPAWRWIDRKLPAAVRRMRQGLMLSLFAAAIYVQTLGLLIHPAAYWALTVSELTILEHPRYQKDVWEIRDNLLLAHFVPEFSPPTAHRWLIWATWNRNRLGDGALAAGAPWYSLNPKWAPKNVRPYLGFDLWFVRAWSAAEGAARSGVIIIAALLAVMVSLCSVKLKSAIDDSH